MSTSTVYPSVEEQMKWLRFKVTTRQFEDDPVFDGRPVRKGDVVAVDPDSMVEPGDLVLCQSAEGAYRLTWWAEGVLEEEITIPNERMVGPVVQVSTGRASRR